MKVVMNCVAQPFQYIMKSNR